MKNSSRMGGIAALLQVVLMLCVPVVLSTLESRGYAGDFFQVANWPIGFQPLLFVSFIQIGIGLTLLILAFALYDAMYTSAPNLMRFSLAMAAIGCGAAFISASVVADITKVKHNIPSDFQISSLYASFSVVYAGIRHGAFLALSLSLLGWGLAGLHTGRLPNLLCILAIIGSIGGILDIFTSGSWVMPVRAIFFLYVPAALWLGVLLLRRSAQ